MKKIIFLTMMMFGFGFPVKADEAPPVPYLKIFKEQAKKHNVPTAALLAIAATTTNFNPDFSDIKVCGIMSYDATSPEFFDPNVDCFDVETNIGLAANFLSELNVELDGDIEQALISYKTGYYPGTPKDHPKSDFAINWENGVLEIYQLYKPYYK